MKYTGKRRVGNYNIYGIISSNHKGNTGEGNKGRVEKHFRNNGGCIYICDSKEKEDIISFYNKYLKAASQELEMQSKTIFIIREEYLWDGEINIEGLRQAIQKGLTSLSQAGIENRNIYITVDSFWNSLTLKDIHSYFNSLEELYHKENEKVFLRYIMEDLKEEYIFDILANHKVLLADGVGGLQEYTPKQLVHKAVALLSKHSFIVHKYEKEMLRLEYLKSLGELMEGTIHDINNLLLTIVGYAQLAMAMGVDKDIQESLGIIQRTALDGQNIVNIFKEHTKGNIHSTKILLEFNNLVKDAVAMAEHGFKQSVLRNQSQLQLVADLNSTNYIYGNEYELRQSIVNIILNGLDAMENQGTMTIKTYDSREKSFLEIIDTGSGMDKSTMENIFQPYFSTKASKGTGLGLFMVKKIAEDHGGEIEVESQIGKGTRFLISFPAQESQMKIAETIFKDYNIT